jgi:hypothetical protein
MTSRDDNHDDHYTESMWWSIWQIAQLGMGCLFMFIVSTALVIALDLVMTWLGGAQ